MTGSAKQSMSPCEDRWIASAFALRRFGGLVPCEACAASVEGSSLSLLAMTVEACSGQHVAFCIAAKPAKYTLLRGNGVSAGFSVLVRLAYKLRGRSIRAPQKTREET